MNILAFILAAGTSVIGLLIWLIVFIIVVWLALYLVNRLPVQEPWKSVIVCLVVLLLLIILLLNFGMIPATI